MKNTILIFLFCCLITAQAQKIIPLYAGKASGSENWNWKEQEMYSDIFKGTAVYNVSEPTLTVYTPPPASNNGTAIIICPGGAFHFLNINTEGTDVARWLTKKGITAFVLKYRLVKSETSDPVKEVMHKMEDLKKFDEANASIIPLAIRDGSEAIKYVRTHAAELSVNPKRVGILGFSAGGGVAAGVGINYTPETRPDFVAPIYAALGMFKEITVPADAPSLFIAAASDDNLGLAPYSVDLYGQWLRAGKPAELHMYMKGGHGFGMNNQNLPVDNWIDRFSEWLEAQGLLKSSNPNNYTSKLTAQQMIQRRRETEERTRNDWANLKRYQEENKSLGMPKPGENRVVFMGNSITEGWKRIDTAFFKGRPYICRGISGQTTPQMLIRFQPDVIALKPKVVVILAGINDIAQNTGPITLEETMANIASMATLAKANGIGVILSSVLPAFDFPWRPGLAPAEKVVDLNKMIKSYAEKNGHIYLDYYSSLVDARKGMKKEYANDEVHPTLAGYRVMEPLVEKAIAKALEGK